MSGKSDRAMSRMSSSTRAVNIRRSGSDIFILGGNDWGGWAVGTVWFGQSLLCSVSDNSSMCIWVNCYVNESVK